MLTLAGWALAVAAMTALPLQASAACPDGDGKQKTPSFACPGDDGKQKAPSLTCPGDDGKQKAPSFA
jgi:hypothetical protein